MQPGSSGQRPWLASVSMQAESTVWVKAEKHMGLWPHVGTGVCKRLRTDAGVAAANHDPQVPGKWGVDAGQRSWAATGNFRQKREQSRGQAGSVIRLKLRRVRKEGKLCGREPGFLSSSFQLIIECEVEKNLAEHSTAKD